MLALEYLAELFEKNRAAAQARVKEFAIGGRQLAFNSRPRDHGSDQSLVRFMVRESVCLTAESAVRRGKVLQAQGADVMDVGAESTLAHAARLDAAGQRPNCCRYSGPPRRGHCDFGGDLSTGGRARLPGGRRGRA